MDQPLELKSIGDIIDLAVEGIQGDFLYRGHRTRIDDEPDPRVFRKDADKGIGWDQIKCGFEPMLGHEFKDYAHSVYPDCPPDDSWLEWLALMQHHGAPTRPLDWTRSVLVAAYFAVESGPGDDDQRCGEVLALNSGELTQITRNAHGQENHQLRCHCRDHPHNNRRVPFGTIAAAKRFAEQAFADFRSRKKKSCKVSDTCRFPLAIVPPRTFSRLVTQRAWFTIHPTPAERKWARPLDEKPRKSEPTLLLSSIQGNGETPVLKRYVIPCHYKKAIRDSLGALCITRATLFADLDGLGLSLVPELQRRFPC